jgi:pimeloyl-ACP methyl ester carboxylesterase
MPTYLTKYLVRRRLETSPKTPDEASVFAEVEDRTLETDATKVCERATDWQLKNHPGFIDAFISAIRHAPITQQHEAWRAIGRRLASQRADPTSEDKAENGLAGGKVVLVLGEADSIIVRKEVQADAEGVLGVDGVETLVLDGGHDLPISRPDATAGAIWASWVRARLVGG